jgi:hypothetical protein
MSALPDLRHLAAVVTHRAVDASDQVKPKIERDLDHGAA